MNTTTSDVRHRVVAVVIHDSDILVIDRNCKGRRYVTFPAGGIDDGETPEVACERELKEEAGIVGRVEQLLMADVMSRSQRIPPVSDMKNDIYLVQYVSGTPHLPPDSPEAGRMVLDGPDVNIYYPRWMPLTEYMRLENFLPTEVGGYVREYICMKILMS